MGSGKSTFAEYLVANHGFIRVPLASTLKAMFQTFLEASGMSAYDAREFIADPELKEQPLAVLNGKTPRYAMQTLGTEWGRELFGENLWVDATLARAAAEMAQGRSVVIDDMRFLNEAAAIRSAGGYIVRITRAGAKRHGTAHVSEGQLNSYDVDALVVNDSGLRCLELDADGIVQRFGHSTH